MKTVRQQISWAIQMVALIILMIAGFLSLSESMHKHNGDSFVVYGVILAALFFALGSEAYDAIRKVRK